MDFRRIEGSGGSEISKFTYVSENVFESKASSCVPVTPLKPEQVRTHMPQINEAYLSSQVGINGCSSRMPASKNGYLQQGWLLPSHNFPELLHRNGSHQAARNGSYQQGLILPSQVFLLEGMSAAGNGSHQQSLILPSPVLQWADGSPAAGMQATSGAGGGRFTPFLLEQINRAVPRPPTAAPRVVGQNQQFAFNSSSKDGFPVPHRANYDLNSPARADVSDGTIGFSIAPVTPDCGGRVEKGQSAENVVSTASGISREKGQEESPLPRPLPLGSQLVEVSVQQSPFPPMNSLPTTMFSKQIAGNRGLSQPLYSSQAVGCTPSSMVFQQLVSSPIVVTTSSADATQGLSQPPEALPSIIPDNPLKENHIPQSSSGVPSTPVKESQGLFQSVEPSPAVDSVPVKENNLPQKGENKGIDLNEAPAQELNKTPAQKPPRRKKHRPKVIREDKPKKPPKPKTPKQAANKGNSTGKRKYVRKTGPKVSSMPQSRDERETSNLENRASKKSCRRSLNFDSEAHAGGQEAITNVQQDRLNGGLNNAASNDAPCGIQNVNMVKTSDGGFGLSCTTGSKPTLQLGNGLEVVALDLHCSVNAVLEKYISLPENPSSPIAREEHIKENSSSNSGRQTGFMTQGIDSGHDGKTPIHQSVQPSEANHSSGHHNAHAVGLNYIRNPISSGQQDHDSSSLYRLQNGIQAVSESQRHSNTSVPVQVATNNHAKASNAVNCPMSQIEPASSASHSMLESDLNKAKMATLSSMNVVMTTALQTSVHWPFSSPSVVKEGERTAENSSYTRPAQSENGTMEQQKVQNIFDGYLAHLDREMRVNHYQQVQNGLLEQEHAEKRKKLKSNPSIKSLSHTLPALPALVIQSQHHQIQSSHGAAQRHNNGRAGNIVHGTLALVDALANTIPKVKTKRRTTKAQARSREGPPSYAPYQGYMEPRGARLGQKSTKRNTSLHRVGKPITTLGFPINDEQGRSNLLNQPNTSLQLQLYKVVEEVICGVQNLNIDAENAQNALANVENAQNALVPFTGEGTMILYDGQADPIKKRRPRAKVDLDEETNRVWKLLMWKEGSDGTEGINAEKEKYWEEQRQIFRGRADSFIARMHLVQGDRRFSPWKGSVVDSVVGVFLTQNVSDHLSSSAFMALAARFPPKSRGENVVPNGEGTSASMDEGMCSAETAETVKWHDKISSPQACDPSSLPGANLPYRKEVANCNESFGSNAGNRTPNHSKSDSHTSCISDPENYQESPENKTDALIAVTESPGFIDVEERKVEDYVISSQTSIVSSQNSTDSTPQATDRIGSTSESNSEAENLMTEFVGNPYAGPTSFTELLAMALSSDHNSYVNGIPLSVENNWGACGQFGGSVCGQTSSKFGRLVLPDICPSIGGVDYLQQQEHHMFEDVFGNSSDHYHLQTELSMGQTDMAYIRVPSERRPFPSTASEVGERDVYFTEDMVLGAGNEIKSRAQQNLPVGSQNACTSNFLELLTKNSLHASSTSEAETHCVGNQTLTDSLPMERNEKTLTNENVNHMVNFNHKMGEACLQSNFTAVPGCRDAAEISTQREISRIQQNTSNLANYLGDALDVVESSRLANDTKTLERKVEELKSKDEGHTSKVASAEITKDTPKPKKGRKESEKKQDFDWDSLRREACCNGQKERTSDRMDSLDWEAVRLAEVGEVSDTIRERGMNNMLAQRIKDFLNRLVKDHGSIDLEWLRDIPPEKAKEYLLSIRGLGLKSVECVRLLTLHHLAFPVDTNVGRICVRLGWVPLQPLPESLQLHLLELYPMLENIQKYLWPRLCTLDQRTLYELHYQMITFGKVFCTKSKPNCNSCPMRAECRHFASAFASARLALPGPEEKGLVTATVPLAAEQNANLFINQLPLPSLGTSPLSQIGSRNKTCEPIIEEPPEPEHKEVTEADIEDAFWEDDPDEIPTIKLNIAELSVNVQNYMQETNMDLEDFDVSKALVALSPDAASIPVPKLKNVSRLRTEHQVYELPDSHPLLKGLDKREPDDPCSYLLAIWKPGETAQSTQPPESCCSRQPGQLCHEETCFSCNSVREANAQTVRGTLLIPCRTAMRGSFPLNGTYFQVNEVFADHDSSIKPIDVPRSWIWNLPRRTVYFGTSVTTLFRGLSTEGIQHCFWRGFVCVRGFDQKTRAPRPLMARLHFPASKIIKNNKKTPTKPEE